MVKDILSVIQSQRPGFSKGQKRIADYILTSYDKAAFMTANKLGKTVNVSESTVVRFAAELGYDGYPAMQKALQEMIRNKLTAIQRIEVSNDRMGNEDVLTMVMHADAENIRHTLEEVDRDSFDQAVSALLSARRIYIMGVRSAFALSNFLGFYFNMMFENVVVAHTNSSSELFEQILRIGAGDVIVGISFPRYSKRTVRAMQYAKDRGATTIAITDSNTSPLAEPADHTLLAKGDMASFVDSLAAPLSLVNALIVAVSRRKGAELADTFGKLEKIWDEYEVYEKTEQ
ncbi:MurR/RpiR family transcriptional regulator [Vermiculatibacterium agrestimuris]|uniref:MurR/RpiR family transcriptional regulator n=1 Tax=Vermiculatibacterium agrestimuris TaxID=2941519 RepID=UPI00203F6F1E|nr:MurR/RpiR family transcriptional regulator [Vermiculatibacterium agrestimuris]